MKSRNILAILLLVLLCSILPAQEEIEPLMYKNMLGWGRVLYPELMIDRNPSVLAGLASRLLFPELVFSTSRDEAKETIPAGQPQEGGSVTTVTSTFRIDPFGGELYLPLGDGMVAGGWVSGGYQNIFKLRETDTNFSAAGDTITTADDDINYGINLGGDFALPVGPVVAGVEISFSLDKDPAKEEFRMVTDPTAADTSYYSNGDGTTFYEDLITSYAGAVGATYGENGLSLGAGIRYNRFVLDSSTGWTLADVNANGVAEAIVADETYETDATYGNGEAAYTYLDRTTVQSLYLYPHVIYELNEDLTLIGTGYWSLVNSLRTEFYERVVDNSQEIETEALDAGLATFSVTGGVALEPCDGLRLRAGVGYSFQSVRRSFTDLDATGGSNFALANTNNYTEVNLATLDPWDGRVSQVAGDPTTVRGHEISLVAGSHWRPLGGIEFYSTARLSLGMETAVYHIFDTSTDEVWSETEKGSDHSWGLDAVVGFVAPISENIKIGLETGGIASSGGGSRSTDALPVDSAGSPTTVFAGGEPNLDDDRDCNFTLSIFTVFSF